MDEGLVSRDELVAMFDEVHAATQAAFDTAVREPKVSVENAMKRLHRTDLPVCEELVRTTSVQELAASKGRRVVMRKAMTTVIEELLNKYKELLHRPRDPPLVARCLWPDPVCAAGMINCRKTTTNSRPPSATPCPSASVSTHRGTAGGAQPPPRKKTHEHRKQN